MLISDKWLLCRIKGAKKRNFNYVWSQQLSRPCAESAWSVTGRLGMGSCSRRILVICPVDKNRGSEPKKLRCVVGSLICWYQKFCSFRTKFGPKLEFLVWQYWPFWPKWCHAWSKTMWTRCRGGFLICGYQKFWSLPKKLGCLAQKRTFLHQNMQFWPIVAHAGLAGSFGAFGVGWLAVGCGARAALMIEHFPIFCYFDLITAVSCHKAIACTFHTTNISIRDNMNKFWAEIFNSQS